jgi:membrane protease subunit HflK
MNVHYHVNHLYDYLFQNADPDGTTEKIAYQVLREAFGTSLFFPSITADRDLLEQRIRRDIQRRVDALTLGISIQSVCFRDVHPPAAVAAAFEAVVSANEDYETYIEQARGYRNDLLPRARASATTRLDDARAYRHAVIAESLGKAQAFSLQHDAYSKAPELTQTRLVLEALEEALARVRKYFVTPGQGGERPDLWFDMPLFAAKSGPRTPARETQRQPPSSDTGDQITDERNVIDAFIGFQRRRPEDTE